MLHFRVAAAAVLVLGLAVAAALPAGDIPAVEDSASAVGEDGTIAQQPPLKHPMAAAADPPEEVLDRQDGPPEEVLDRQDDPPEEVLDRQDGPPEEVLDRQGDPAEEVFDRQDDTLVVVSSQDLQDSTPVLCSSNRRPTILAPGSEVALAVDVSEIPQPCLWIVKVKEAESNDTVETGEAVKSQVSLNFTCDDLILVDEDQALEDQLEEEEDNSESADVQKEEGEDVSKSGRSRKQKCRSGNFLKVSDGEGVSRVCGFLQDYSFVSNSGLLKVALRMKGAPGGMGDFGMEGCRVSASYESI